MVTAEGKVCRLWNADRVLHMYCEAPESTTHTYLPVVQEDLVAASSWTLVKLAEAVLVSCLGERNRLVLLTLLARPLIQQSDSR